MSQNYSLMASDDLLSSCPLLKGNAAMFNRELIFVNQLSWTYKYSPDYCKVLSFDKRRTLNNHGSRVELVHIENDRAYLRPFTTTDASTMTITDNFLVAIPRTDSSQSDSKCCVQVQNFAVGTTHVLPKPLGDNNTAQVSAHRPQWVKNDSLPRTTIEEDLHCLLVGLRSHPLYIGENDTEWRRVYPNARYCHEEIDLVWRSVIFYLRFLSRRSVITFIECRTDCSCCCNGIVRAVIVVEGCHSFELHLLLNFCSTFLGAGSTLLMLS